MFIVGDVNQCALSAKFESGAVVRSICLIRIKKCRVGSVSASGNARMFGVQRQHEVNGAILTAISARSDKFG